MYIHINYNFPILLHLFVLPHSCLQSNSLALLRHNEYLDPEIFSILFHPGSFITIYLFSKRWKIEDSTIGVIACLSRTAASVVYALAPTRTVYFLGPLLDMFSSAGATSLRSIATKLVEADEIGMYYDKSVQLFHLKYGF